MNGEIRFPDAVQRFCAAPLIRDPSMHIHGPRISSAPRRKNGALRSIRGMNSATLPIAS
jgi:hypothetical protein